MGGRDRRSTFSFGLGVSAARQVLGEEFITFPVPVNPPVVLGAKLFEPSCRWR
jgi:hypothetical protein